MIHIILVSGIIGFILGMLITLAILAFMMGACPDSEKKRQEDWEALQRYKIKEVAKDAALRIGEEVRIRDGQMRNVRGSGT